MHIIYTVDLKLWHSQLADIVDMMTPMREPLLLSRLVLGLFPGLAKWP